MINRDIRVAETDAALRRCFPVIKLLRPQLDETAFVDQVRRQQAARGFVLAYAEKDGEVAAVAGFWIAECLAWGRYLYVDDLVSSEAARGAGCASVLFDWLYEHAREQGCAQFHLDSGVQRFIAHRFYLHKNLDIVAHHFSRVL